MLSTTRLCATLLLLPCYWLTLVEASFLFHQTSLPSSSKQPCSSLRQLYRKPTTQFESKGINAGATLALSISLVERSVGAVEEDSIEKYSQDVSKVLLELRPALVDETLPDPFKCKPTSLTFAKLWNLDDWTKHTSRWRYVRYVTRLPRSRLLRRTLPQLTVLTAWSICAAYLRLRNIVVDIPVTSLSLVSTFVAALLTLRSNQGLTRLSDCRDAVGKAVLYTRDTAQLIATTVYPKDKQVAMIMMRHISIYLWLLKSHLRGTRDDDIVQTMLPNTDDANYIINHRKTPVAILSKLRQCLASLIERGLLNTAEHLRLEKNVVELDHVIMTTERIRASPIPPLYSSHTGRLLMLNLFLLPLSLTPNVVEKGKLVFVVLTTVLVGFAMFGLDEISFALEQPFRLMPLYELSKVAMRDVSDALVYQPPPLPRRSTNSLSQAPTAVGTQ